MAFENFGTAVAIDGQTAVVTTPYAAVGATDGAGAAYVYVLAGATWTLQAQLSAADPKPFSNYGRAVAIVGDTIVVGAQSADGAMDSAGAAYVYTRTGSTWSQQAKLFAADGEGFNDFGAAVAVSGNSVVIGAPSTFINGENVVGAAYVFVRVGSTWSQQQKLVANDGLAFDSFGNAVAVEGDKAIVAASQASVGAASFSGAAYAFSRSGSTWTQTQKLSASDAASENLFGQSVAISGSSLVVGAPQPILAFGNGGPGAAYVFVSDGTNWIEQAKLVADDGVQDDAFGTAVAISGNSAVVGAPKQGSQAGVDLETGALYAYARSSGVWTQQSRIRAVDGGQGAHMGARAALSATVAIAGAPDATVNSNPSEGKAYLFTLGTPVLSVAPAAIDFGDAPIGRTTTRAVTVRNLGTADLFSGALVLIGNDAAQFAIVEDACSGQRIAPAGSCKAQVGFTPAALATYAAQVVVPGSAGVQFVSLAGQGVPVPAQIAVTPNPVNALLDPNQTETQTITVHHPGDSQTLQWTLTQNGGNVSSRLHVLGDATPVPTAHSASSTGPGTFQHATGAPSSLIARPTGLPPIGQTLSHSASETMVSGNSISCGNNETGTTNANQFLRTFTLADFGIDSAFKVSSIRFGIESSTAGFPATVNLYVLNGFFSYFNLELVASTTIQVQAQSLSLIDVPISATIPAGSTFVLEIATPDLESLDGQFLPGSNAAGQTAPSYIAASRCGSGEPQDLADIGFPDMHLVMSVTGESAAPPAQCALPAWLDVATQSGAVAPGGSQAVDLHFDATGLAAGSYSATLCFASNAEDALYTVPVTLSVGDAIFANGFD
ncbi:MAG: choice-of-anchor D domain-containing protein [Dokdonella sp.]